MSEILSQDEVNALLAGVQTGAVATGGDGAPAEGGQPGVRGLDLTSQERSLRGRWPGLELIVDRYVRGMRAALSNFFASLPTVSVHACELIKFEGIQKNFPAPVSLQLFRLQPLRGQGMLIINPAIVSALMQVSFGGLSTRTATISAREFSPIEQRLIDRLTLAVLRELGEAWRPIEALELKLARTETNPMFLSLAGQELMLQLSLRVEVEGLEDLHLAVCLPNAALDPIRQKLQSSGKGERDESVAPQPGWGDLMRAVVAEAQLELSAELGSCRMQMKDVLSMKAGDVIHLGTSREGPVLVRVEGRPRFLGAPGVSRSSNAVRITARL